MCEPSLLERTERPRPPESHRPSVAAPPV